MPGTPPEHEHLVDSIYEAATLPSHWPAVLQQISGLIEGMGGVFIVPKAGEWIASPTAVDLVAAFMDEGWAHDNERTRRLMAANHPGFVTDFDVFRAEEFASVPVYREFFLPRGIGSGVATAVEVPTGDAAVVHFEREFAKGPFPREYVDLLDGLRPHLARAALLTARLNLQKARAMAVMLEMLGLPGAVLSARGNIVAANDSLSKLIPRVVQDRPSRVALANVAADGLLATAIASVSGNLWPVSSIPIPAHEDMPPYIVHLAPVKGEAQDIFGPAAAILIVTPVEPHEVPSANVLQGLFDLTPSEALIARLIAEGKTVSAAARRLNLTEERARTLVTAVFAKTGLMRQTDLVRLLRGVI